MTKKIALGLLWVAYVLNTLLHIFLIMMTEFGEKHCRIIGDCSGAGIAQGWIIFFFCLLIFVLCFFVTTTWFLALKNKNKEISISHRILAIVSTVTPLALFSWWWFASLDFFFKVLIIFFALILIYCITYFFYKKAQDIKIKS